MPKPRPKRHWHWLKTGQLCCLTLIVTATCIPFYSNAVATAAGATSYLTTETQSNYMNSKSSNNTPSQLHSLTKQQISTKAKELHNPQATQTNKETDTKLNLTPPIIKQTHTHNTNTGIGVNYESTPSGKDGLVGTQLTQQHTNRPNVELNLPTLAHDTSRFDGVAYSTKTIAATYMPPLVVDDDPHRYSEPQTVEKINFSRSSTRISANWPQNNLKVNQVFESQRRMTSTEIKRNSRRIVLLGLFELSNRQGQRLDGWSELSAAQMAVEHINRKRILPNYTLELLTNDTQCDPGVGVDRFFHAIYTQPDTRMIMLLGSACSEVTESLAKVVPHWSIVQVSFGSTSPALSDRKEFPNFYRTVAPDSSHNPARIAFIRFFGWDTVTTFSQNEEVHSLAVNDLVTELEAANISCAATITFAATDFKEQLLLLRESILMCPT